MTRRKRASKSKKPEPLLIWQTNDVLIVCQSQESIAENMQQLIQESFKYTRTGPDIVSFEPAPPR